MKSYVIDASVAVKWYIPEPLSESAEIYLQLYRKSQAKLLAPDLLIAEVGNVLVKKTRYREINSDDARAIIHAITTHCPLTIIPALDLMPVALDIALNMGLTVYDSLYLALTIAAEAILITADNELVKLASKSPFSEQIVLLK